MPDLLVVYATKMGATREIAEVIAEEARAAGLAVTVQPAATAPDPSDYRAVVVGSGLYLHHWRPEATRYLRRYVDALREREVWLFQDGPCGIDDGDDGRGRALEDTLVPRAVRRLVDRIDGTDPVTFGGRLDREHATGLLSRWMARSPEVAGDYRDWTKIRDWARDIAAVLVQRPTRDDARGIGRTPGLHDAQ
jgi:menaquinone-dependent protoporphyrinogen oxidase